MVAALFDVVSAIVPVIAWYETGDAAVRHGQRQVEVPEPVDFLIVPELAMLARVAS